MMIPSTTSATIIATPHHGSGSHSAGIPCTSHTISHTMLTPSPPSVQQPSARALTGSPSAHSASPPAVSLEAPAQPRHASYSGALPPLARPRPRLSLSALRSRTCSSSIALAMRSRAAPVRSSPVPIRSAATQSRCCTSRSITRPHSPITPIRTTCASTRFRSSVP